MWREVNGSESPEELNLRLQRLARVFEVLAEETGSHVFTYDIAARTAYTDENTAKAFGVDTVMPNIPDDTVKSGRVAAESAEDYLRIYGDIINGKNKSAGIVKMVKPGGTELKDFHMRAVLDENGNPTGFAVGLFRSIADLEKQENRKLAFDRALKSVLEDHLAIYEVELDTDRYTSLWFNLDKRAAIPDDGRYSEAMKPYIMKAVAPEYREQFEQICAISHLKEALSKESRIEIEYKSTSNDSSWRRTTFLVSESKNGVPAKVVVYHSDIDKIKSQFLLQQSALKEAYDFAESANAAKSDFLSRMSHDIRTPMNAIVGMTAIARRNAGNREKVVECLDKISTASEHLLGLINEVLDMSKIESGSMELNKESFNVAELIDRLAALYSAQLKERNLRLDVNMDKLRHEWIWGDSMRIQQVFDNIVSNAVKYTKDGGTITVSADERYIREDYYEYTFTFADTGIGMNEEFRKVIFEPFTRAHDSRITQMAGTGLGMAIVQNLVHMMDGSIDVKSELGKGSVFTVRIPFKTEERRSFAPPELNGLSLLVVDNDRDCCESVCLMAEDLGMKCEYVTGGREAAELAARRHEQGSDYFAAIIDWQMPEMDGIKTAEKIKQASDGKTNIILLTAYDYSEISDVAKGVGITKFLSKPLFRNRLADCFGQILSPDKNRDASSYDSIRYDGKVALLVEDNELNAEISTEILSLRGFEVYWAKNGLDALNNFKNSEEGFYDIIFMDIQMPVMDGHKAAAEIRKLDRSDAKTVPIIAMTANAFTSDVAESINAGMNEHIAKPIERDKLEQVLIDYVYKKNKGACS